MTFHDNTIIFEGSAKITKKEEERWPILVLSGFCLDASSQGISRKK